MYVIINEDGTVSTTASFIEGFEPLDVFELDDNGNLFSHYEISKVNGIYPKHEAKVAWTEYNRLNKQFHKIRDIKMDNLVVEFDGHEYQADEMSQLRMASAITALEPNEEVDWVDADNHIVKLTAHQLVSIKRKAGIEQVALWNEGRPEKPAYLDPF